MSASCTCSVLAVFALAKNKQSPDIGWYDRVMSIAFYLLVYVPLFHFRSQIYPYIKLLFLCVASILMLLSYYMAENSQNLRKFLKSVDGFKVRMQRGRRPGTIDSLQENNIMMLGRV